MLIPPVLALLVGLIVVWAIGLGPATLFFPRGQARPALAVAVAPAFGLALLDIIGFSLVLFWGPARVWAWPIAAVLIIASLALAWRQGFLRQLIGWRWPLKWLAWYALIVGVLISPLLVKGIQYTAFRSNASDAFFYMSLAETARTVDWEVVEQGLELSKANLANVARLAEASPTSLLAARVLARPASINHLTVLAWLAELGGTPIYQFYYAFHLLLLAAAVPVVMAIARLLRVRRPWLALAGATVALGFWARQVLEMDASYELSTVPVLALAVFAWMMLERAELGRRAGPLILLAISLAALTTIYFPVMVVFVGGLLVLGGFHLFQRRYKAYFITYFATAATSILIVFIVGQLAYHYRSLAAGPDVLEAQRKINPATIQVILTDGLGALLSLPARTLFAPAAPRLFLLMTLLLQAVGLALVALAVYWLWQGRGGQLNSDRRVLLSIATGGAVVFALFMIDGNAKAAGKAFTYTYPYFLLVFLVAAYDVGSRLVQSPRKTMLMQFVSLWLVAAVLIGALLPYNSFAGGVFRRGRTAKTAHDFDLSPILRALDDQPGILMIHVPRDQDWVFPYYVMQVLRGHPAQYQSGLIIDNSVEYQNLWTHRLEVAPDYLLTAAAHDYMAGSGRGELLQETQDLRLYRVTHPDPAFFLAQTAALEQADLRERKPFPNWQP